MPIDLALPAVLLLLLAFLVAILSEWQPEKPEKLLPSWLAVFQYGFYSAGGPNQNLNLNRNFHLARSV